MSYVTSVGGDPINPLIYTYTSLSITSDITMVWPSNNQNATYTATDWVDITSDAARTVTMPPANEAGTGDETVFYNWGSYTITINDSTGGNITTVASGLTKRIWITDNSTAAGTWRIANIGSGTTNADASMLAGYGIVAQAGLLSQSMPTSPISTTTTLNAGYRAYLVIWTGGSGTITLPSAVTVGSNWFLNVKNSGTGTLTVASGSNIDGSSTVSVAVNEGFTIATNGSTYYTIGRLTPNTSGYTFLSKSVTGSTDITLSAAESVYNIINYTGTLGANISIIVPSSVNEWIMSNSATGSTYTLQIRTGGGTGVTLSQGKTRTLYSDASDVFFSDAVSSGTVTSVGSGTGLTGGPITSSGSLSLANTAVSAGNYTVPNLTVDAQGRITAASSGTSLTMTSIVASQLRTPTSAGSTLTLQAYDTDGTVYSTFATLTAGTTPTMDLDTSVTIGSAYIYRIGGTDVAVADGGTGTSSLTANNVILGNGTSSPQFVSPSGTGNVLTATGTTWTSSALLAVNATQTTSATPAAITSTTGKMIGLAGAITPVTSGKVLITICGAVADSSGTLAIKTGTGSAPANGDAATGTTRGIAITHSYSGSVAINFPFSMTALVAGLTLNTAIWIDLDALAPSGAVTLTGICITAVEL